MSSETVAACTGCGRGYLHIQHEGVRCMACGAPVRMLPAPEEASDDAADRLRWKALVNQRPAVQP
jgi:hypothetical protein